MTTSRRAVPLLGAAGLVAAALTAVAAGRAYTGTSVPPTRWWGLVSEHGWVDGRTSLWGVLLWVGITGLSACWLGAVALARRGALRERQGWTFVALWALPLTLGPPAVSKDVWAYVAQGLALQHGANIYRQGPDALAGVPGADAARALAAVDPRWRDDPSPYGPATSAVQWLAGAFGDPVPAVVVLRVVAAAGGAGLAGCCVALARSRRAEVLVLVALNPVLLVHGLSAAHVEALMCALLVAAVLAADRGRWPAAVVLVALAGLVKAPAFLGLVVVVWWHARTAVERARRGRVVAVDVAIAAVVIVAVSFAVPDGWGWLRNLSTPGGGEPTSSPAGQLAALAGTVAPVGKTIVTVLGALAALAVLVALARSFERRHPAESLGWGLLAVAFLAPVTYPWYALWGLVCLLPFVRGRALVLLMGLSVIEAGWSIPGGSGRWLSPLVTATAVVTVAVTVLAWRRQPPPPPPKDGVRRSMNAATPSRPSGEATAREIDSAS